MSGSAGAELDGNQGQHPMGALQMCMLKYTLEWVMVFILTHLYQEICMSIYVSIYISPYISLWAQP